MLPLAPTVLAFNQIWHGFNHNFIVGVTGSIAAYKGAELTRSLIREGANVRVIMTEAPVSLPSLTLPYRDMRFIPIC